MPSAKQKKPLPQKVSVKSKQKVSAKTKGEQKEQKKAALEVLIKATEKRQRASKKLQDQTDERAKELFTSIIVEHHQPQTQKAETRYTLPILTKYERANAIGTRARQIGMNYPIFVDVTGMDDEVAMARKELYAGQCPLIVRRFFPNHTKTEPHFEDWPVSMLSL